MSKTHGSKYAEIAVSLPVDKTFHYRIPRKMQGKVEPGKRVWIEFGKRKIVGYVVGLAASTGVKDVKPIKEVIDESPVISAGMRELCGWIKDTYLCSLGQAMDATIPGVLKKGKVSVRPRAITEEKLPPTPSGPLPLTGEQQEALRNVLFKIDREDYKAFLLHGITASGKTEVYLQAIEKVLGKGKTSIVLVPEIALTPQTVERFTSRFGNLVAVVHSALLGSTRYREWKRILDGTARIVVGARSAVFSPVKNLGLIIVDEEHETSYKQEDVPRYHARDVALMRGKLSNCPVILGSATPSLESYYLANKERIELVKLTKRIDERSLPKVKIVDMRMELATRKKIVMFSRMLTDSIQRSLSKNGQVMIFLNRRGFSTYVNCKRCGLVLKCKRCDSVLVYHYMSKSMVCHYCNFRIPPPNVCPQCRSSYMKYFGIGTEKVESEVARLFPGARIARMDTDATSKRGSHEAILGEFKKHNIDILVGTQMIAKGLDFPRVTLVGVVNADVTLNLPDFRASERTFNLLTQVAGRAGRGEEGGEVILQTYAPDHYAILCASKHDYEKFYREEIKSRRELSFPPFTHIVRLTLRSRNEKRTVDAANNLKKFLEEKLKGIEIIGPAPSPVSRVRGYYRWNVLLKSKNRSTMCEALRKALASYRRPSGVLLAIDVDPISF
ncbi:MAG: primosomal protein N' [Candidatus Omnitrophota bacterium]